MEHWQTVFKRLISQAERSSVSELLDARLCRNIAAPEPAEAIRLLREELLQQVYSERARNRTRYQASIENQVCNSGARCFLARRKGGYQRGEPARAG